MAKRIDTSMPENLYPREAFRLGHIYCPRMRKVGRSMIYTCGKRDDHGRMIERQMRKSYQALDGDWPHQRLITWWVCPKCGSKSPGFIHESIDEREPAYGYRSAAD